jgi:hypothetical protein
LLTVRAAPPEHYGWLCSRLGLSPGWKFRAIEAVDTYGRIQGMVGYENWTESACFMHCAVDNKAAYRRLLHPSFEYPFIEGGRSLVLGLRASNHIALNNARVLGFRETYRIKDGWATGEDMVLFEMRKDECRWLRRAAK